MRVLIAIIAAVLLAGGCVPDLTGWEVVRDDVPRPRRDGGVPPGVDGGPGVQTGGPCGRPTLFAAAQELGDGPGRVMRWQLQGTGGLVPCNDVVAEGALGPLPFAVAAVSDELIAVASQQGVVGVNPIEDRALWTEATMGMHPNDAFVVTDPSSRDRVPVVAWSGVGVSAQLRGPIRFVEVYEPGGGIRRSLSASDLMLGSATAMAASPRTLGEAIAVNANVYSLGEVSLFGGGLRSPALIGPFEGGAAYTISAGGSVGGGSERVVWSAELPDPMGGRASGVVATDDVWSGGEIITQGAGGCGEMDCTPVHAVIDPSVPQGVVVICEGSPNWLVTFDLGASTCNVWAQGPALGTRRLSYLAVLE